MASYVMVLWLDQWAPLVLKDNRVVQALLARRGLQEHRVTWDRQGLQGLLGIQDLQARLEQSVR